VVAKDRFGFLLPTGEGQDEGEERMIFYLDSFSLALSWREREVLLNARDATRIT
jgi:hypothetical protein